MSTKSFMNIIKRSGPKIDHNDKKRHTDVVRLRNAPASNYSFVSGFSVAWTSATTVLVPTDHVTGCIWRH